MEAGEYVKTLGRDEAYVEMDVANMEPLLNAVRLGADFKAKQIVLKCGRLDLSEPRQLQAFMRCVAKMIDTQETKNMSDEQMGFYLFRKIFETGIETILDE